MPPTLKTRTYVANVSAGQTTALDVIGGAADRLGYRPRGGRVRCRPGGEFKPLLLLLPGERALPGVLHRQGSDLAGLAAHPGATPGAADGAAACGR